MGYDKVNYMLGSTDAAERVLHPRPTWDATSDAVAHASLLHLSFFFFFCLRFAPTWLDSRRIGFNSRQIGLIRPKSGRIGRRSIRPKSASKLTGTTEILTSEVFLAFFFLCFVNQGIVMYFLIIF